MTTVSAALKATPAQAAWLKLGYGMFLHFGPNSFTQSGWGDGRFPAADFNPRRLDPGQWAGLAAEAGMKYAVFTSKHHDGFCLWPSRHTEYCTRNSPGRPDVVGRFVEAFRKAGLRVGLYYSLWDRNFSRYEDDGAYTDFMFAQIEELLTQYGPVLELWFDGGWDKDHPTRLWMYDPAWEQDPASGLKHGERWRWRELYAHIHKLQSDCLVIQNSSSDRPGRVKYFPVDARTSEHFNFLYQERICEVVTDCVFTEPSGERVFLPLEYTTSLDPDWFWSEGKFYLHPSAGAIRDWRRTAQAARANFLLNVGPNKDGLIPEYHRPFLLEAARAGER